MKSQPPKDPNQGEGDRISARHYNQGVREFVKRGDVDEAAREAAEYVEAEPEDAKRAERVAKRGPHPTRVSVDELVAKGRNMLDRVRPYVQRIVSQVRHRLARGTR
ncbi:MAG TPA: hypothetical protein VM513_31610 [Kofleriaceae bacterium]|jgi:hypothetical protein|nr:hypothetical protein [Kofleriaceae bacterium]